MVSYFHNNKFVFFGTPEFAAIILEKLIQTGMAPALVICNPDRPVGRKKIITAPPAKIIAQKYGVNIWQPENLELEIKEIKNRVFDFFVVAAYSKILPKEILAIPRLSTIGIHPSLLPKYRGTTPIQNAILAGEKETGVTLFLTDEKVDHGPILAKRELRMTNDDNYDNLQKRLAALGADLLIETLPKFLAGEIKPQPQDESKATYTKKFRIEDAFIDLNGEPEIILRKIKALNPEPGVWTIQNGKRMKILDAEIKDGKLKLKKIQVEGKKAKNL